MTFTQTCSGRRGASGRSPEAPWRRRGGIPSPSAPSMCSEKRRNAGGLSSTVSEASSAGRSADAAQVLCLKHGYYSAEAKRVRRDARQQYRLLRQLIAAGNEDDVLDLISSM